MIQPELLAPAGNLERLKIALAYGADAVYIGGQRFGLRAFAGNFSREEMEEGIACAHRKGKKVYVTMNIFARNEDFAGIEEYIRMLGEIGADAVILSDPGILDLVRDTAPEMEIHLSTQANTTNWQSALFWHRQGVKRIILARELSLKEIRQIRENTPESLELEAFVHGALCMSYSGRCTISNYLTGRDANRGECTQPCRWKYYVVEEKRPGEYMPVVEDDRGTYLFHSGDLCMLEHIPALAETGLSCFKIEGRMKTGYYTASVLTAYRRELDRYFHDPVGYAFDPDSLAELKKAGHRPFTTGFYFNRPGPDANVTEGSGTVRGYDFVALFLENREDRGLILAEQRNNFRVGDRLEIMRPRESALDYTVEEMYDEDMNPITVAPHPQQRVYLPYQGRLKPWSLFRRKERCGK